LNNSPWNRQKCFFSIFISIRLKKYNKYKPPSPENGAGLEQSSDTSITRYGLLYN